MEETSQLKLSGRKWRKLAGLDGNEREKIEELDRNGEIGKDIRDLRL